MSRLLMAATAALVLGTAGAGLAQPAPTLDIAPTTPAAPGSDVAPAASAAPSAEHPDPPTSSEAAPTAAAQPAAKGHVYFFRPSRLPGAVYTYHVVEVGEDGKPPKDAPRLGNLPNGGAFVFDAEPGVHSYNITGPMAVNKAEDRLRMEVEPDTTYYVEQTVRMGLITGGFRLVPADEARFAASKAKLEKSKQ